MAPDGEPAGDGMEISFSPVGTARPSPALWRGRTSQQFSCTLHQNFDHCGQYSPNSCHNLALRTTKFGIKLYLFDRDLWYRGP
jgi:hypothetical protein